MSETVEYQRQSGSVELVGYITGLDRQKGKDDEKLYNKETSKNKKYRELAFNIQTNEGESGRVRMRSFKNDHVYYTDSDNNVKKTKWKDRKAIPKGCRPFGQVSYHTEEVGDDNKRKTVYELTWDAIPNIITNFKDGELVRLRGKIEYNSYNDNVYRFVEVTNIYHSSSNLDEGAETIFENEEFRPVRKFKQKFIFDSYEFDTVNDKHIVYTKIITDKDGDTADVPFEIDYNNEKLHKAFSKVHPGTEITALGEYYNRPLQVTVTDLVDEDDYGFSDGDDYAELIKEYDRASAGYEDLWIIKVVPVQDADGNKLIIKEKYNLDDLADIRADKLSEKEDKKENKKSSATIDDDESEDPVDEDWDI